MQFTSNSKVPRSLVTIMNVKRNKFRFKNSSREIGNSYTVAVTYSSFVKHLRSCELSHVMASEQIAFLYYKEAAPGGTASLIAYL